MTHPSLEQKLGQLFILGFAGSRIPPDHPLVQDIVKRHLGGVILFDRSLSRPDESYNIVARSQLKVLTNTLQKLSEELLLVAVDQEGGKVSRFTEARGFPVTPAAAVLGSHSGLEQTLYSARQTAEILQDVGINYNLAPVVDLNIFPENPIIGKYGRSFSSDPEVVALHAAAWIKEHKKYGIRNCLKHFPGHGSSRADSHLGFADISESWQDIELLPYEQLITSGQVDSIMIGHLFHHSFDTQNPATLSQSIIEQLLRRRLHFEGIVITDDMQMKAITSHYNLEEACLKAIVAGADLVIIGNNLDYDPSILSKVLDTILRGLDRGILSEKRVDEAWARIQKFKQSTDVTNGKH